MKFVYAFTRKQYKEFTIIITKFSCPEMSNISRTIAIHDFIRLMFVHSVRFIGPRFISSCGVIFSLFIVLLF